MKRFNLPAAEFEFTTLMSQLSIKSIILASPGSDHNYSVIISAFFKLLHQKVEVNKKFILDILFIKFIYIFHVLIIEVSNEFKILIKKNYEHDSQ